MSLAKELPKGVLLEGRVQRLLFHQGYFSFRNIFLPGPREWRGGSTPDIDVLGYRFTDDFVPTKIIYDCKAGGSKAVTRILWLQSLARMVEADRTYMVRPNTPTGLKFHGLDNQVYFVDHHLLTDLEKNYLLDSSGVHASSNSVSMAAQDELRSANGKNQEVVHRAVQVLNSQFWFFPAAAAIKRILATYEQLAPLNTVPGISPAALHWVKGSLVNLFVLGILRLCSEVANLSRQERITILRQRLVSDRIPYEQFGSLVKTTFEYAYTVYGSQTAMPMSDYYQIPPPEYADSLIDLVDRALMRPRIAVSMPRFSDLMVFEYVIPEKPVDQAVVEKIIGESYDSLLAHFRDYLFFLTNISPCTSTLFKSILPDITSGVGKTK